MSGRGSIGVTVLLVALASLCSAEDQVKPSKIKSDEQVIFFPTAAHLSKDGTEWLIPIHGWIFEPEAGDLARRAMVAELDAVLDIDAQPPAAQRLFHRRVGRFLVDNERGKSIAVALGDSVFVLDRSHADGHFAGEIALPVDDAKALSSNGKLTFDAVTRNDDGRRFKGEVHLIASTGMSVISDIDDTIKVSDVTDRKAMLRRTFFEPFEQVPGMARLYNHWATAPGGSRGSSPVSFHFVSSSPWQLYEPLAAFVRKAGFPEATFHLKRFRLRPSGIKALLADPMETKPRTIRKILDAYPNRRFILVGDSGEKDPEVYGRIARECPQQIVKVLIRNVTAEPGDSPRYGHAFKGIPAEKWQVFKEPAEVRTP